MKALLASVFCFLLFLTSTPMRSETAPTGAPHELLGFLLRQSPPAFTSALGKPFNEGPHGDGETYQAFHIPNAKETYLVAVFAKKDINAMPLAVTLELTGTDYKGPTGFLGLRLGDDSSKVQSLLGKPSEVRREEDVNVDLWDYKQNNYSLEFTPDHKLYSIQIVDEVKSDPKEQAGAKEAYRFAMAIKNGDVNSLMLMSSGELECTRDDWPVGFKTNSARAEFENSQSRLFTCLKAAAKAILQLGPDVKGADNQIRLYSKGYVGTVTIFPDTSPLKEVVFTWEDDRWRVYEVTFRSSAKHSRQSVPDSAS